MKIILPSLLVIGMFSFPVIIAWHGMQKVQGQNQAAREFSQSLIDIHQMQAQLPEETMALKNLAAQPDTAQAIDFSQSGVDRAGKLESLTESLDSDSEGVWLAELKSLNNKALALPNSITAGAAGGPAVITELQQLHGSMRTLFSNLAESLEARMNDASLNSSSGAQEVVRTIIFMMAFTGVMGLGLAAVLTRRISRPVKDLVGAAHQLSEGKLDKTVEVSGKDELAQLGHAFNHMAVSLKNRTNALFNEQSKLRSVHQSITDGILVFGNNGFVVSANPAAEALLEKTEASLAGSRSTGIRELDEIMARPELIPTENMVACWDHNSCAHEECPSYASEDRRCWLQCGTCCHDEIQGSFIQKRDACERCPVYRINGCVDVDAEFNGRSYSISAAPILNDEGDPEGRLAILHDMTDERHRSRQLGLLNDIANTIVMTEEADDSLKHSLNLCMEATKATSGSIMLLNEDEELIMVAHQGLPDKLVEGFHQKVGEGIAGWVAQTGEALLLTENDPDPRFSRVKKIKDAVCIPIRDENAIVGVLSLNERQAGGGFSRESLDFLGPVALQMGMALTRTRLYEKISREKEKSSAIVESMGESLCVRAPDRTILFANSAHKAIFGEDCEGKHCYEVYVGRDSVCRSCPLDRCFETGDTVRRSHFVMDQLGIRRQLETTASPLQDADGNITSCIEISRDVTEMLRIRNQAESRLHTLTRLFEVSNILSSSLELSHIVDNFTRSALEAMHASSVTLMLFAGETRELKISSIAGDYSGWSVAQGDVLDISNHDLNRLMSGEGPFCTTGRDQLTPVSRSLAPPGSQSILVGRLTSRGKLLGLISAASKRRGAFSEPGQLEFFVDITNQAAVAIDNAEMYTRLEETFWCTIRSLAEAIDAKDSYTRGHSDRVADYAEALARKLGLDEEMLHAVRCAGYLHDTGKIGIPDAILLKPGKLSKSEYTTIMNHPILSHKIIEPVDFPYEVKPLVRHHHERIDGSGYPDGLSGEEIPLGARIIGIADAYEAMTSDRPYRKALSRMAALDELQRCAGTQFDAELVEAFLEVVDEQDPPAANYYARVVNE